AGLHVDPLAGDDLVARSETLRSENIGLLAAVIGDERDERRAVRVIFQPLDRRRNVPRAALEIDVAILLLVAAGDPARGHVTLVVAAAGLALALGQRLNGLALPQ